MSDTKNVKLGVCQITYGGVDLGYTKGGVEVNVATETHKMTVDQFGESEINEYIMKRTVKVSAPLAETTVENMVSILPGATLITDAIDPLIKRVEVTNGVGADLLQTAQELVLHPIALAALDKSEDFIVPLAATAGALQFAYKFNEERVFNVEFSGYPDPATKVLFTFGDPAATA